MSECPAPWEISTRKCRKIGLSGAKLGIRIQPIQFGSDVQGTEFKVFMKLKIIQEPTIQYDSVTERFLWFFQDRFVG